MILNSSWSIPASDALRSNPMFNKSRDFPALGKANEGSSTAKSVYQNDPTTSQTSNPASVNRGPPHTWGQSSITGSNVSQGPVNQANRVLPHLRGNIYTANSAANAAGSPHTQAAPNKIDNQYGSSLTRAGGNDTYAYASDAPDLATIPGVGVGTNEKIRPLGQYVAPRSSAKNGPTQSPWGSQNLFPDAPPVVAPPVDLLSSLNIGTPAPPIKVYKKFDPADPAFKASKYYVDVLHKWKCPHQGCNGSFKTSNSFIGHLKSPAHSDEKFQCLKCYRYYNSATALAQHAESQGVRCNVRDTDDFESVVRGITAGTTTTNGRLADDTVRYEINPDAVLASKKMAESYRAVTKDRDEARRHYWDDKTPQW
ncbi:hypothetical protein BKA65DRAFT_520604 [Rhexocercosporidium sp. MPI-PUGE-AT-0058]|nr:hypothetical protein BKA65DRAFT_520604 [Rhexocercosporidium sp. MPI-PUGE-AT-0058]